jgi:hypothetical protein
MLLAHAVLAAESPHDPVRVFYPAGDCSTGVLEIELWNRVVEEWRPHPAHARIMADTCQLEDAGDLLNEIRVRCVDPGNPARASDWLTGVQVYEPADAPGCVPPEIGVRRQSHPRVSLTSPEADAPVRTAERDVPVVGRVRLTHDQVVMIDASFDAPTMAKLAQALSAWLLDDDERLGPTRLAWLAFDADPAHAAKEKVPAVALSDDAAVLREGLASVTGQGRAPIPRGLAAGVDAALAALEKTPDSGDRRTLVALIDASADYPFGEAAGRDPKHRRAVLEAVERVARAGVALEILAIGRSARDLAELADQVRARIAAGGAGGQVVGIERVDQVADSLPALTLVTLREVRVENLSNGSVADPLAWDRAGRFEGRIPLQSGRNLLRVRALLSSGRDIVADFERRFDPTALRERLRAEEAARIERARKDAAREGRVTVDVEDR